MIDGNRDYYDEVCREKIKGGPGTLCAAPEPRLAHGIRAVGQALDMWKVTMRLTGCPLRCSQLALRQFEAAGGGGWEPAPGNLSDCTYRTSLAAKPALGNVKTDGALFIDG